MSIEKWLCQFPRNNLVVLLDIALHYIISRIIWVNKTTSKKGILKLYVIKWTTPVSQKRITYHTERRGNRDKKGDCVDGVIWIEQQLLQKPHQMQQSPFILLYWLHIIFGTSSSVNYSCGRWMEYFFSMSTQFHEQRVNVIGPGDAFQLCSKDILGLMSIEV